MAIEIGSIGYNHTHEDDFHVKLPGGPGAYLFLLVKSNSIFTINNKRYNVAKNSYVMLNPHTPCSYKGQKVNYKDDWFFFWLNEDDKQQLIDKGVIFDQPVFLQNIEELSSIIHRIAFEHFSSDKFHAEIKQHYTDIFFYQLARIVTSNEIVSPDILLSKNDRLTYLRTQLFQNPDTFSNVDEMASFINLSRSGFQHLYNKVFGHSVIQDIIAGRIEKAKEYLKSTNLTISEIGSKCGYKSEYHFMRQFKEQTGRTPTAYRNSDSWNHIEADKIK